MKITNKFGLAIIAGLALGAVAPAQAQDKPGPKPAAPASADGKAVNLKPRYTAEQEIGFTQRIRRDDTMTIVLGDQRVKFDCTVGWKLKVVSAGPEGAEFAMTVESAKADWEQESKAGDSSTPSKASWDSTAPNAEADQENPVLQALRPIVGLELKVKLNADGNITSVTGSEGMQPSRKQLPTYTFQIVSPEHVKARWGHVFSIKDGSEPAKIGQTWPNVDTLGAGPVGDLKFTTSNTLKSVDKDLATVAITGAVELVPPKASAEGPSMQAKMGDSSVTGTCQWDTAAGLCRSLEWRQKMSLSVQAQGFDTKRDSDVTITTTRK